MSARADSIAAPSSSGPWIYGPWLDLIVGCGAWSAPLLALATWLTSSDNHAWVVAFYLLAIAFNYPHFMATVYRAYHTRADFEKYKVVTLHVTLLMVATGVILHAFYWLLPWVFTLYICWSPWHYSGQNFGLLMMFVRRSGAAVTPLERRSIRIAFVASYVMLLASFETGGSADPLILSLGLPAKFTLIARVALGVVFAGAIFVGLRRLIVNLGWRAMAAPLMLAITQFLWFVLPTLLELRSAYHIPQTRYSSGILAVLHSAQYLWITSYYQRREARSLGQSTWSVAGYFLTLIAGGIALFIPGPWIVSRVFRFDFTTSFLIFTALVNIHHFILDGALWKLRDSRIASVLVGRSGSQQPSENAGVPSSVAAASPPSGSRILSAGMLRTSLVVLLLLWGGIDQVHFALGTNGENLAGLRRAARMNPYDSMLQARIALAESRQGRKPEAVEALRRAVDINPHNAAIQHACARAMIEDGQYAQAYDHYAKMLRIFPRDSDALVNYGLLAAHLGHTDEAIASWRKAEEVDPTQPIPHLYLAEALDRNGDAAEAAPHWRAFLQFAAAHPDNPVAGVSQRISASIQLADDESRANHPDEASAFYRSAIASAQHAGDSRLASLALVHLADLQERANDTKAAADSYQRSLVLDAKAGDPRAEASDWFNYGQFLRRHGFHDELAYACLLHAETMMAAAGDNDLETVKSVRRELESHLGKKAATVQINLPTLLARATEIPAN